MKAQEILNKIKEAVGVELSEEVAVQLEEMKLENGTILEAEKFESGQSVFIKSEDGNIALPVGEYDLEDGRKLMVKEEGLIDAIGEVEVEEEEVEASEETITEEVKETELEEDDKYVTKEEFAVAVDEIKAMIEKMGHKDKKEMSEEVESTENVELSAEPIVHNPEAEIESKSWFVSKNYPDTIQNRIYKNLNQ
jgi:hypothetical protein